MSTIGNVERKIRRIEHFEARFLYLDGTDVRSDKRALPPYHYEVAAGGDTTVNAWKNSRFLHVYPGYDVKVLDRWHRVVQGNMKLATVRDTYGQ